MTTDVGCVSGDSARRKMPDKESLVRSCGLRRRISVFRKWCSGRSRVEMVFRFRHDFWRRILLQHRLERGHRFAFNTMSRQHHIYSETVFGHDYESRKGMFVGMACSGRIYVLKARCSSGRYTMGSRNFVSPASTRALQSTAKRAHEITICEQNPHVQTRFFLHHVVVMITDRLLIQSTQ
jgi:hypothetical protein